jgi:transcriptional regulator with XRE-family HTH domain
MAMRKSFKQFPPPNIALHEAIFTSGYHQQDIAKRANVSPAKLSHAIYRRRALDHFEQERLARVLGKPLDELFPPEFEPPPPPPICPPPPEREL